MKKIITIICILTLINASCNLSACGGKATKYYVKKGTKELTCFAAIAVTSYAVDKVGKKVKKRVKKFVRDKADKIFGKDSDGKEKTD